MLNTEMTKMEQVMFHTNTILVLGRVKSKTIHLGVQRGKVYRPCDDPKEGSDEFMEFSICIES